MLILGIESSCDETAASVARDHTEILSNVVSSQVEEHKQYGRRCAGDRLPQALRKRAARGTEGTGRCRCYLGGTGRYCRDRISRTVGALLVGVNFAKGLALAAGNPLCRRTIGRTYCGELHCTPGTETALSLLVVSGGHSHLVEVLTYTKFRILGRTRDDAAGECFDKCARAMGYPYPGGIHLDKASKSGNPKAFSLPKPKIAENAYDFSFSGLKTAVVNLLHNAQQKGETICREDLAASVQATISEVLTEHTIRAAVEHGYSTIAIAGRRFRQQRRPGIPAKSL